MVGRAVTTKIIFEDQTQTLIVDVITWLKDSVISCLYTKLIYEYLKWQALECLS